MNPKINKLSSSLVQEKSDEEVFGIISKGAGAMPGYKYLSKDDRWDIVNFIRSLNNNTDD
ncbi:MAG: mono/diheme cytochrome c family protein [Chlamydiales bacterium]|jgi:mono/diheme cytochrome c family protein